MEPGIELFTIAHPEMCRTVVTAQCALLKLRSSADSDHFAGGAKALFRPAHFRGTSIFLAVGGLPKIRREPKIDENLLIRMQRSLVFE